MKKTIFTVIVAVFATAFFMVGNSFAEDQEQEAQENIISTADCTAQGTGIISGMVKSSCGTYINDGRVISTAGTSAQISQGFWLMLVPAGSGSLSFQAPMHFGESFVSYKVCSGESSEIPLQTLTRIRTCPTTTSSTTTSVKSECN
jgi:hypothetical protein